MKNKIIMTSLMIIVLQGLNGCASTTYPNDVEYRPGYLGSVGGAGAANYNVGYGPDANAVDFNHDSSVGYGGVNVYDFNSIHGV